MRIPRYRKIIATFFTLIPSLTPYLAIIFCIMCLYCSLGLQLFGGLVYANNPKLEGTSFKNEDYLVFNFNDYPSGMVTLFNLLVMGNWQIWMEGYVQITGTSWALLYFISFYVITVLLLVNLVVAFVLEAFFAETELASDGGEDETDQDAKKEGSRPKRKKSAARSGRIKALLHHMLSAELEEKPM